MTTFALNRIVLLVLLDLERREDSACVSVVGSKAKRAVHVRRGHVVGADSNLKAERLGDMLVGEGLLDPVLLEPVAAEGMRQKRLLGDQLVIDGLLTAGDLGHALERQVALRTGSILSMRGEVTVDAPRTLLPVSDVPVTVAVVTAFRTTVPLGAIEAQLAEPADAETPLQPADDLLHLELGPAELRLARRLTGGETLDSLLESGAPRERVLRLAGALRAVGLWR